MTYTPFNTGNPIGAWGSVDPQDLVDNAAILDRWVNDRTITQWRDRFVVQRLTWNGMEVQFQQAQAARQADFETFLLSSGYQFVGDYDADGPLTITHVNQIFSKDGEFWRAGASLSLPYTTVNDWATDEPKFVSVGDAALRQELAADNGSGMVGFLQSGDGTKARTIQDKMRDQVSIKDFGATPGGVVDSTGAVQAAGLRALVPPGEYLANTRSADVVSLQGPGFIRGANGALISLARPSQNDRLVQKKMMEPFFGFDNGVTDTQIYNMARNSLQGIAYCRVNGVEKLFVTQRPIGPTWADTERVRFVEFNLADDGSVVNNVAYSPELNVGHGFDLSALVEGDDVILYTSSVTDVGKGGTAAGKGYSRTVWKGAATTQADVTSYQLWGDAGSGHVFQSYSRAGVAVSSDGRLLLMVATPDNTAKRTVFVYDKAAVEALASKLDARPLFKWNMTDVPGESAFSVQGICSDGRYVHILKGGTTAFGQHHIVTYELDGTLIRQLQVDDARAQYGASALLNHPTLGNPARFEPEGLTLRGDEILLSCTESWRAGAKIVTFQGQNWAAASIESGGTTGVPPSNGAYFVRTTKAATDGAWNSATDYGWGTNYSLEKKTIYSIKPPTGSVSEQALDSGIADQRTTAEIDTGESDNNVSFRWRNSFSIRAYSERLRTFFNALSYDTSSRLRIYDQQYDSNNGVYASVQALFSSIFKGMILRGRGAAATESAYLRLHAVDDPTYPNYIIEGTLTDGTFTRETNNNGSTRFASASGNTPVTACRPDDGMMYGFEKTRGANLWGIYRGTGSPEGVITAARGALFISATGGANTLYVKESGTGNTGWVGK